jgi:serine protease Do
VVVSLIGWPLSDNNQLTRDVGAIAPGQNVRLDVVRDSKPRAIDVKLAPRPDESDTTGRSPGEGKGDKGQGDLLGLSVDDLTPELARRARVDSGTRGAVVVEVANDSPASEAGLEPGDVIVELNRKPVESATDYRKAAKSLRKGDNALLRVKHGQLTQYVPVRIK